MSGWASEVSFEARKAKGICIEDMFSILGRPIRYIDTTSSCSFSRPFKVSRWGCIIVRSWRFWVAVETWCLRDTNWRSSLLSFFLEWAEYECNPTDEYVNIIFHLSIVSLQIILTDQSLKKATLLMLLNSLPLNFVIKHKHWVLWKQLPRVGIAVPKCELTLLISQQCMYSHKLQLVWRWVHFLECSGTCVPPLNTCLQFECNPGGHYARLPASVKEFIKWCLTWSLKQL